MKRSAQGSSVHYGNTRVLPGAVSLAILLAGAGSSAQAQEQAARLEEVVVTGTRIRGADGAVGASVTQLGEENFRQAAEVTVSDLFKNAVPSVLVDRSQSAQQTANWGRNENVDIHGLGDARTLVLVNGARIPMNGWSPNGYDPSIIPAISLERADMLSAGASASYGSDAIAGVINLVLRRGFEGAQTQVFMGTSDGNRFTKQVSQLFGTTWDTGGVTIGFEYYDREAFPASDVRHMTPDFTAFGFADNTTPITSAAPAIVSTGPASTAVAGNRWGTYCQDAPPFPAPFNVNPNANCYSVPTGTGWNFGSQAPGATVDWATLAANNNVDNLFNYWDGTDYTGPNQRTALTMTLDQEVNDNIEAFFDFFHSDRSQSLLTNHHVNPLGGGAFSIPLRNPADYPYTPTGAPAGLFVNYSLGVELPGWNNAADEEATRVSAGLNFEGGEWNGRVYYAYNVTQSDVDNTNATNSNNINAALGNVVFDGIGRFSPYVISDDPNRVVTAGDLAGQSAFVQSTYPVGSAIRVIDPASVPFLNVFCDPRQFQCNDPRTIDFIRAHDRYDGEFEVHQVEATVGRDLFEAPGGTVQMAVGTSFTDERFTVTRDVSYTAISTEFPEIHTDLRERDSWSVFGELRFPIFSEQNARPGFRSLEFQLSARRDDYSDFGDTTNPRLGADWEPIEGLTIRGNRGRSFRAPAFSNLVSFVGGNLRLFGTPAGGPGPNPRFSICTGGQIAQAGQPTPGSFAERVIDAIGAASCSDQDIMDRFAAVLADPNNPLYPSASAPGTTAADFLANVRLPGIMALTGGVGDIIGRTAFHPPGSSLQPEESESWSLGFDFEPPALGGRLTFGASYFSHRIENFLARGTIFNEFLNNPATLAQFTLRGDAGYDSLFDFVVAHPLLPSAVTLPGVSALWDLKDTNLGTQEVEGIDYNARYEWGDRFTWHAGVVGTYWLHDILDAGGTVEDSFSSSLPGFENRPTAPQSRLRAQFGWNNNSGFSAILFMNYQSRYYLRTNRPTFGSIPGGRVPSFHTFDLTLAYDTADGPSRDLLRNTSIRLSINNLTDEDPAFVYQELTGGTNGATDQTQFTEFGPIVSLSLTKSW